MTKLVKIFSVTAALALAAISQSSRADNVSLGVGIGMNVRPTVVSGTFISQVPYVPAYQPNPTYGYQQTFYQPNFYYGGGYYQDGNYVPQPIYYRGAGFYGNSGYYGGYSVYSFGPNQSYRTAPVQYGPQYNGQPTRLTFGPLSRW